MMNKPEYIPARRNAPETEEELAGRVSRQLLDLLGSVPLTEETRGANSAARVQALTKAASNKAALAAGTLALPP